MSASAPAQVSLVLHAHLQFVSHPENDFHLEELWFFEAMHETYLPLVEMLRGLDRDGVPGSLTVSASIPLLSMMDDPLLRDRFGRHLSRMIEFAGRAADELDDSALVEAAAHYDRRLRRLRTLWEETLDRDVAGEFGRLDQTGRIDLITCAGTHALLPLMATDASRRGHVRAAVRAFEDRFGRPPRGMWLPECAFSAGIDRLLADEGIAYSFTEGEAIERATPRPSAGNGRPIVSEANVAFFGRDRRSGAQVWSAGEGYPGDPSYREFYRDLRYALPDLAADVFGAPAGLKFDTGLKCHRVTGDVALEDKEPYDSERARRRVDEHAADFVEDRVAHGREIAGVLDDRPAHLTCAYDAELFGHWWFEGPSFLDAVVRRSAETEGVELTTPRRFLQSGPTLERATPATSTWGEEGDFSVWVDEKNAWLQPRLRRAERAVVRAVGRSDRPEPPVDRLLAQAVRELMLAQASDWSFILEGETSVGYAVERLETHLNNVHRLVEAVESGRSEEVSLRKLEERHGVFPDLDWRGWRR